MRAVSFGVLAETEAVPVVVAPYLVVDTVIAVDGAALASALGVPDFATDENPVLHMDSAPSAIVGSTGSIAAPVQSLWQTACIGMRTLLDCDWTLRRANAVAFVTGTTW